MTTTRKRIMGFIGLGFVILFLVSYAFLIHNPSSSVTQTEGSSDEKILGTTPIVVNNSQNIKPKSETGKIILELPSEEKNDEIKDSEKLRPNMTLTKELYDSGFIVSNKELCPDLGRNLRIIVLIASDPVNQEYRTTIRKTWGYFNKLRNVSIGFFIGFVPLVQNEIKLESEIFGDIIQSNTTENYQNQTAKTISMYEWIDTYCPQVPFFLKTQDNTFINIPKLLDFVKTLDNEQMKIYGQTVTGLKPTRNKQAKDYVGTDEYPKDIFPDFITGPTYLVPSIIVHGMRVAAFEIPFMKLENVFMTGLVAEKTGAERVNVTSFYEKGERLDECTIKNVISICDIKPENQFEIWAKSNTKQDCKKQIS